MGAIFGKKKPASRVTEQDKAVLVRQTRMLGYVNYLCIIFIAIKTSKRSTKTISKKN